MNARRATKAKLKEMDRPYPGPDHHPEEESTFAIDGEIHETAYFQPIRRGCEIFFIPKLEEGELRTRRVSPIDPSHATVVDSFLERRLAGVVRSLSISSRSGSTPRDQAGGDFDSLAVHYFVSPDRARASPSPPA